MNKMLSSADFERILHEEMPMDWLLANHNGGINEFYCQEGYAPNGAKTCVSVGASYETNDEGEKVIVVNLFMVQDSLCGESGHDEYINIDEVLYEKDGFKPSRKMLDQLALEWNNAILILRGENK